MTVYETILSMIEAETLYPYPVTGETNLYTDLGFDSLSFAGLLVKIEDAFSVSFGIAEMQGCLQVDALVSTVEKKLEEGGGEDA